MPAAEPTPILPDEAARLLAGWQDIPSLLIAVSGGPDSLALLWLAQQWRAARGDGPMLHVATVDHGLRPQAADEAHMVADICARLGLPHVTLHWQTPQLKSGVQEAAREARYSLLAALAQGYGVRHLATAHHLDDQAETVLLRLAAGSGLTGLAGMAHSTLRDGMVLLRPLLDVPKARLVATCRLVGLAPVEDAGNTYPGFARGRLRGAAAVLRREGLSAARLGLLARRMRRADETLAQLARLEVDRLDAGGEIDCAAFDALLPELALRVLGLLLVRAGGEVASLSRLERLFGALYRTENPFVATLGGVLVRRGPATIRLRPAPPRRRRKSPSPNCDPPRLSTAASLGKGGAEA